MATISSHHSDYIPEDITRDIFSKLPVKSLIRFQSLSKGCAKLFKTSSFISEHLQHSQKNPSLLCSTTPLRHSQKRDERRFYLIRSHEAKEEIEQVLCPVRHIDKVVGSCNGLICLYNRKKLTIWNPATKEFRQIELPSYISWWVHGCEGYGFSAIVNDYKIVLFFTTVQLVYSLGTGKWRETRVENLVFTKFSGDPAVFADGALFWIASDIEKSDEMQVPYLISFNIDKELISKIELPASIHDIDCDICSIQLAVYKDSLAMLHSDPEINPLRIDVWVKDEKSAIGKCFTWVKLFTVGPLPRSVFFSMGIWRGEILLFKEKDQDILSLCSPNRKELRDLPFQFPDDHVKSFIYSESLVPIDN